MRFPLPLYFLLPLSISNAQADWFDSFGKEDLPRQTVQKEPSPIVKANFNKMIEKLNKYNQLYPVGKHWQQLKQTGTDVGIEIYIDMDSQESIKIYNALNKLKRRIELDSNYSYLSGMSFSLSPVFVSKDLPYANEYLNKGMAHLILMEIYKREEIKQKVKGLAADKFTYALKESLGVDWGSQKGVENWLKRIDLDKDRFYMYAGDSKLFNRANLLQRSLEEKPIKDIPLVIGRKFALTATHVLRANENQLIDLLDYIAILSLLDRDNLLSNENQIKR